MYKTLTCDLWAIELKFKNMRIWFDKAGIKRLNWISVFIYSFIHSYRLKPFFFLEVPLYCFWLEQYSCNLWPSSLSLCACRDLGSGSSLSFSRLFYDEHWSKHRVITCLDWSPQVRPPTSCYSKSKAVSPSHVLWIISQEIPASV